MTEAAFDRFLERWKTDLFGLDGDRPGLDFGEIEDIIDEIEQIVSGRVDVAGKLDLLRLQIALMRHVREKLRFIFRGEDKFRRLFLEGAPGLFDFHVFALDFRVLVSELPGLLFEFFVGLLEFLLSRLQLHRELRAWIVGRSGGHSRG